MEWEKETGNKTERTRLRILNAAVKLFDAQGYDGTTVRQIAEAADVNLALISYHFQGKQGLLEVLIATYYEKFFQLLEGEFAGSAHTTALEQLQQMIRLYVFFQRDHAAVTRLVQRELSVESMLAREVMTVYIHRWKHGFASVIEQGMISKEFETGPIDPIILAMTSLLVYPYQNPQTVREVYYLEPNSDAFCEWLISSVIQLVTSLLVPIESQACNR
ncbi:forespore capture DNA-binding protein RefZ [Brevibacillus sp. SYSU BS000544]|uniref:forespore capture DNA-binding protein RefZ n=1 Tax=Brevibacillus sp. SYSU BS000544 TaxID=3416443 RepID=UPI003CE52571